MDDGSSIARSLLSLFFSRVTGASQAFSQAVARTLPNCLAGHNVMALTTVCGVPLLIAYLGSKKKKRKKEEEKKKKKKESLNGSSSLQTALHDGKDARIDRRPSLCSVISENYFDSSLLKKHSSVVSITTDDYHYPSINLFYREHSNATKLCRNLPLLVFIHGLGGQMEQFRFQLEYFVHISHVLAVDLPGCGKSQFAPRDWAAYRTDSLCKLIATIVKRYLGEEQKVVLVAHSMGSTLAATLATEGGYLYNVCAGMVAVCPKAILTPKEKSQVSAAVLLGDLGFDIFRIMDRRGGVESKSVLRFVSANAPDSVKNLQLRFNEQSRTSVWRRMAGGLTLASRNQWVQVKCPIYLIGGGDDKVTPIAELETIYQWLIRKELKPSLPVTHEPPKPVAKKCIIPNAGHSLIFETHHVVNGLINDFLANHVDEGLSLSWQLSYLKEDKWLLKNLEKWAKIQSVSPRVGRSPFRAMKTLRQTDEEHNPPVFCIKYPDAAHVIDISHEQPPYDPSTFGSQVQYYKFATVSKIPPTPQEVANFIELVDSIRAQPDPRPEDQRLIACHCHYGFNRTGFFLCSYMIERLGYDVHEALAVFKKARDPGIKHPHFIAELFERYACPGLQRPSIS